VNACGGTSAELVQDAQNSFAASDSGAVNQKSSRNKSKRMFAACAVKEPDTEETAFATASSAVPNHGSKTSQKPLERNDIL
jgi:hypothetical protein